MSESFFALSTREQRDILQTISMEEGLDAGILEKDIWICWILKELFSIPNHHPMAFKGGTSLSKVYRLIDRFSEDIDITLDYRKFEDSVDPLNPKTSTNQINKLSVRLKARVCEYTNQKVLPALNDAAQRLIQPHDLKITISDDGEKVNCQYASVLVKANDFIESRVLLEFGGRNLIDPSETHSITPDIAEYLPELEFPESEIVVLSPKRTFWEKATLIHVECHRKRLSSSPEKLARHWYDLMCIEGTSLGEEAISDRSLLNDVIKIKRIFYNASYANYDDCLSGKFRLVPERDELRGLRSDYRQMQNARMIGNTAPDFDELIDKIQELEVKINQVSF